MARFDPVLYALIPATAWVAPLYAETFLTQEQAQRVFFPQATAFVEHPVALSDEQRKAISKLAGVKQRNSSQATWQVMQGDQPLGWFLVDEVIGKHEFITYALGISPLGEVIGVEILVYRETHGGQVHESEWREHFHGKTLADPFELDNDVPNIAGATLSCRNVMNGVKRLLALRQVALSGG
jgi:Na+-translocating ferredoxin:NAD+ oxidoreductase subunit G